MSHLWDHRAAGTSSEPSGLLGNPGAHLWEGLLSTSEFQQVFGLVLGCWLHLWVEVKALPCFPLGQSQIHAWLAPLNGIIPKPSHVPIAPTDEDPWEHWRSLAKENLQMSPRPELDRKPADKYGKMPRMFASQMGPLSLTLPPGEECPGKQSLLLTAAPQKPPVRAGVLCTLSNFHF